MKRDHSNLGTFTRIRADINLPIRSKVIVVGELQEWRRGGRSLPSGDDLAFLEFEDLTQETLDSVRPAVVISPLLSRRFDCVEVAERLWELCYGGRVRALGKRLPNPDIVRSEVTALFPGLDFDVVDSLAKI